MIRCYDDFIRALLDAGFSIGGGSAEDIFSLYEHADESIRWHTGDPESDPWQWRVRVLTERNDIAYAKVFFKKSGYITKEWYPCFLACRRGGRSFEDAYMDGEASQAAKRVYEVIRAEGVLPFHTIKSAAGFTKEDASKFERALTELQAKLFITMCGMRQKVSQTGEPYGWSSTVFCATEQFFGAEVFESAARLNEAEAASRIAERILQLNPAADARKIAKFIRG